MPTTTQLFATLLVTTGSYALYEIIKLIHFEWTSPLHDLPGPKRKSWILGDLKDISDSDNFGAYEKWIEEYGPVFKYNGVFGLSRLFTIDPRAINHILTNSFTYQKPRQARFMISEIIGNGLLVTEEEKHKQQRKVMNPAFGAPQIRALTEIFVEKSIQLRDLWEAESEKQGGVARIDVLSWLSRMTLDVIGLAGFNYHFDNLKQNSEPNELNKAIAILFGSANGMKVLPILRAFLPFLRFLPTNTTSESRRARATMHRIGQHLLEKSKAAVTDNKGSSNERSRGRDLLSLLVRANMSTDLPENQRMKDEDVLAQVPTFLVAGHETTSTATTWALYTLCVNPHVQTKLREELYSLPTEDPTMDQLNSLPYLDAVVREVLRLHSPVPASIRVSMDEDILPFSRPYKDRNGVLRDSLRIRKGQAVIIPIIAINHAKEFWGEDAMEFKPERWQSNLPETTSSLPGCGVISSPFLVALVRASVFDSHSLK